jgi:succinate dehydrogenase / fumarate reductase flavoprotein subunit
MRIFPAVHYSMGGIWTQYTPGNYTPQTPHHEHKPGMVAPVDTQPGRGMALGAPNNMMTNIPGLYAFGEVNFAYHGATRLGANALLSCIFDGLYCGQGVVNHVTQGDPADRPIEKVDQSVFDKAVAQEQAKADRLLDTVEGQQPSDDTNPYLIGKEMGEVMEASCTVVKTAERLKRTLDTLAGLRERFGRARLPDAAAWTNQSLSYSRAVGDMLILAEMIAKCSLLREESRGSHYRTDVPDRDDERFLKTTVAGFNASARGVEQHDVTYREVQTMLVKPRPRTYGKVEEDSPGKNGAAASGDPGAARTPEPASARSS